ncbi:hypothetical protein OF83DRAFT_1122593 [Amylostereum chailletii]|nr:hypothetical protein OF83DRAFT_1122593 [Amylostereum chailletii]
MTMTPEDVLRYHTAHEGLSKDRTELTKKALPKAPKGKKKAPGKIKSSASQAASASTPKLPSKASKVPKSSDPVNCPVCHKSFGRRADCERHIQTGDATHLTYSQTEEFRNTCTRKKARPATSQCPHCNKAFPRQDSMRRHAMKKHKVDPNTLRLVMDKHKVDPDTTQRFEMVEMDVDEDEEYEYEDEDEEMDMD